MSPSDARAIIEAADDLLLGLCRGLIDFKTKIAAAGGLAIDDEGHIPALEKPRAPKADSRLEDDTGRERRRPRSLDDANKMSTTALMNVPKDVPPTAREAYSEGRMARALSKSREDCPHLGDRGIEGGRRAAWLRAFDGVPAAAAKTGGSL